MDKVSESVVSRLNISNLECQYLHLNRTSGSSLIPFSIPIPSVASPDPLIDRSSSPRHTPYAPYAYAIRLRHTPYAYHLRLTLRLRHPHATLLTSLPSL